MLLEIRGNGTSDTSRSEMDPARSRQLRRFRTISSSIASTFTATPCADRSAASRSTAHPRPSPDRGFRTSRRLARIRRRSPGGTAPARSRSRTTTSRHACSASRSRTISPDTACMASSAPDAASVPIRFRRFCPARVAGITARGSVHVAAIHDREVPHRCRQRHAVRTREVQRPGDRHAHSRGWIIAPGGTLRLSQVTIVGREAAAPADARCPCIFSTAKSPCRRKTL
jgi:hypothetical protein